MRPKLIMQILRSQLSTIGKPYIALTRKSQNLKRLVGNTLRHNRKSSVLIFKEYKTRELTVKTFFAKVRPEKHGTLTNYVNCLD